MTLNFFINKSTANKYLVFARVTHLSERINKYTKIVLVNKNDWDKKAKIIKRNPTLNSKLFALKQRFNEYLDLSPALTPAGAIDFMFGQSKLSGFTFVDAIDKFIEAKKTTHKPRTLDIYRVLKTTISGYEAHFKTIVTLEGLLKPFLGDLAAYMIERQGNLNSTVKRRLKHFTTVLKFAYDSGLIKDIPRFNPVQLKTIDAARFPLYRDELEVLKNLQTPSLEKRFVLDAFLFACETGIRLSDIKKLKPEHIKIMGELRYIDFVSTKTSKSNTIALSNFALSILERYINATPVFKLPSDMEVNRLLKKIFKTAELNRVCEINQYRGAVELKSVQPLWKIAHFHLARHTNATHLIASGVSLPYVQESLGHSDIKTTMLYNRNNQLDRFTAILKSMNQ